MRISDWSSDVCSSDLHPRTADLLEQVAQRVEQHGIEAWQSLDPRELLGDEADQYEKNRDTLDVWFDSGTTHATVLGGKDQVLGGSHGAELAWPADLSLEGSEIGRASGRERVVVVRVDPGGRRT